MTNQLSMPYAVVLGLTDTGYCVVVRSLSLVKIPIIGFESNINRPEILTKLCEVRIYKDEENLLNSLISLSMKMDLTPVLFATSDSLVRFCARNKPILSQHFLIDIPSENTVSLLLEKDKFPTIANEHGFNIPKTIIVNSHLEFKQYLDELKFPCVVKPCWRADNWKVAKFPKIFFFSEKDQLIKKFSLILSVENRLVIQEWIPGFDEHIYFSLVYYNKNSKCIAEFTGRKLRQWPVGTGSTSCAEPVKVDIVKSETIRLFNLLGYSGFGSVEFKKHAETGEFYIMEPTVGRPNFQSFLATANGVNMPAIAYEALSQKTLDYQKPTNYPSVWIDDQFDILSIFVQIYKRQINFRNLFRSYYSKKSFRFLNRRDLRPFLYAILMGPKKVFKKLIYRYQEMMRK